MAERSIAPDCKSGGLSPTQVRILLCPLKAMTLPAGVRMMTVDGAIAGVAQLVELQPSKLVVAGSSPVARSGGMVPLL